MIEDIIKTAVTQLTGFTFHFGKVDDLNVKADNDIFPVAYLLEPITSDDDIPLGGRVLSHYPLMMLFLQSTEAGLTPMDNKVKVNAMRDKAMELVHRIKAAKGTDNRHLIHKISNVRREKVYESRYFNQPNCGCILFMKVSMYDTVTVCPT